MDSGNSGSLQSSSSGDGGGVAVADVHPPTHFNSLPIQQPSSNFFDPSSFSQPLNPNPSSMYNLDSLWSRSSNSDPVYNQDPYRNPNPVGDGLNTDYGNEKLGVKSKNPKKRTRASRRAPTTVLTTDTTNFRQMVQEFTGIPVAPFSASTSSSALSRRIDLYGGGGVAPMNHLRPSYLNSASDFHITPSETHGFIKQPLNLSNLSNLSAFQNQMFPSFQPLSQTNLHQQVNATERENHRTEVSNAFQSSSSTSLKRWRGEDENLMNFRGVNGNSQDAVISAQSVGDQLPGNEDSWSFD